MTSKLVDRARFLASGQNDPHSVTITELCDEIERLRKVLSSFTHHSIRVGESSKAELMGWHYVAVRHEHEGEVSYELHEEFPDIQEGSDRVRTDDPTAVIGDSPAELAKWLRRAADDVEKYAPIETTDKEG